MKPILLFFIIIILSSFTLAQSIDVKDKNSNILLKINDIGTTGSITLPFLSSIDTATENSALYRKYFLISAQVFSNSGVQVRYAHIF